MDFGRVSRPLDDQPDALVRIETSRATESAAAAELACVLLIDQRCDFDRHSDTTYRAIAGFAFPWTAKPNGVSVGHVGREARGEGGESRVMSDE